MKSKESASHTFLKYYFRLIRISIDLQFRKERIGWTALMNEEKWFRLSLLVISFVNYINLASLSFLYAIYDLCSLGAFRNTVL